jgi:hypothetical protein
MKILNTVRVGYENTLSEISVNILYSELFQLTEGWEGRQGRTTATPSSASIYSKKIYDILFLMIQNYTFYTTKQFIFKSTCF